MVWSAKEFGSAKLGNSLRTDRLVAMGALAACKPHGPINLVYPTSATREAAYRFLGNAHVDTKQITAAAGRAALERGRREQIIVFATDGSSGAYDDPFGERGMGSVGSHYNGGTGFKVMTTIGMTLDGTPLGIAAQTYWARPRRKNAVHHQNRPFKERESKHWVEQIESVIKLAKKQGLTSFLWFNGDAEADIQQVLEMAANADPSVWLNVRNAHNRRVHDEKDPDCKALWDAIEKLPRKGSYRLRVAAGVKRTARRATMRVRAGHVTLKLRDRTRNSKAPRKEVRIGVVWAVERGTTPKGEEPIEWVLLTTAPIDTWDDVERVLHVYSLRWRIEDFHKSWKTGCGVENSLLGSFEKVTRWAAILASVAIRAERIKHLARNEPELRACTEFSDEEIEAASLLADPENVCDPKKVSIAQMVDWIAIVGGYVSYRGRPPPGTKVLARGLLSVMEVARALRARKLRRQT